MIAACIAIAVLFLAAGAVGVAIIGRSVVRDVLGHEAKRLKSHDGAVSEKRVADLAVEQEAHARRLQKLEMGNMR